MPFATAGKNSMLDDYAADYTWISLHSAYSASGANELTGGSPAYARQQVTWNSAASGALSISGTETFDVAAASTVAFVGIWSANSAGTFAGMFPAGSSDPTVFTATNAGDLFTSDAHGLVNTDTVVLWDSGPGDSIPTGVTEGTVYYVISVSGDTFQLSLTSGGSAIVISSDGGGYVQKMTSEVFSGQGQYTVSALTPRIA